MELMFTLAVTKPDGFHYVMASCERHIAWTLRELNVPRAQITNVDPDMYTCKGCLHERDGVNV